MALDNAPVSRSVLIVAYPGVQLLDVAGPLEVFALTNRFRSGAYDAEVVSTDGAPLTTSSGLELVPHASIADRPGPFDTVIVAGGEGTRQVMADAALRPGADGHPDPGRVGIYLGSALGGVVFAEAQHERYMERGIKSVSPTLALAVFGGAAPANLGMALGVAQPVARGHREVAQTG